MKTYRYEFPYATTYNDPSIGFVEPDEEREFEKPPDAHWTEVTAKDAAPVVVEETPVEEAPVIEQPKGNTW